MFFSNSFISATKEFNTQAKPVNAPYIRKKFTVSGCDSAEITVTGLGFYELYVNGENVTKGLLAPYISNPEDIVYYDRYDVSKHLVKGANCIGLILGNGMQNALDRNVWQFENASWRGAPMTALALEIDGKVVLECDETFKTSPSPILFDDLRCGERYDARLEIDGWNLAGLDDSGWANVISVPSPKGEKRLCQAEPIKAKREIKVKQITKLDDGYMYDFGYNSSGYSLLKLRNASPGQAVEMIHTEVMSRGKPSVNNIIFGIRNEREKELDRQNNLYIAKGEAEEIYAPRFAYYGYQYIYVRGVTAEQATEDLLTYVVAHSDVPFLGGFDCSHEVANKINDIIRNSDMANFFYFPTDCPHREKNGWTGDAAVSAEQMLYNFGVDKSLREWLANVRAAQKEDGRLPGIVPTGGWGFEWGNGPMWDAVITWLPYEIYKFTGNKEVLSENAGAILKYLKYAETKADADGLFAYGLADWCSPRRPAGTPKSPLRVTDSIINYSALTYALHIFEVLEQKAEAAYVKAFKETLRSNIRRILIDKDTLLVEGDCQTSQAVALYFGIFDESEERKAFEVLLSIIRRDADFLDVGIIGARAIFHVLTKFGHSDLAFKMITRPEFPSYGNQIKNGATSLWEDFGEFRFNGKSHYRHSDYRPLRKEKGFRNKCFALLHNFLGLFTNTIGTKFRGVASLNHHFYGDVSAWYMKRIAGLDINPSCKNIFHINITPDFISELSFASAYREMPYGKASVKWEKKGDVIILTTDIPDKCKGDITLPAGFMFENKERVAKSSSGTFKIIKS
jgi:alpha-L-rhamnosidase